MALHFNVTFPPCTTYSIRGTDTWEGATVKLMLVTFFNLSTKKIVVAVFRLKLQEVYHAQKLF